MSDTEDQAYASALGALQFFSLEQPQQLESLAKAPTEQPRFFLEQLDVDRGCDYFIGVACVFKTYKGALYDKFASTDEAERLGDFNHRLDVFMQDGTAAEWSVEGLGSDTWRRLRTDARKALEQLGEALPIDAPGFDIGALINPDEFITSGEAKALLDPDQ